MVAAAGCGAAHHGSNSRSDGGVGHSRRTCVQWLSGRVTLPGVCC
jgi:hypothetical protein